MLASDEYFEKYTNLQAFKHELLRRYLNAWFPILARSGASQLLYVETHAGKGGHESGEPGSPLVAIRALLDHSDRQNILAKVKVRFLFVEFVSANAKELEAALAALGPLPPGVQSEVLSERYETTARRLNDLRAGGGQLPPAFIFVDPFSFLVDADALKGLMQSPSCEVLYNFMWENARQAIGNESHAANMDRLFGSSRWRSLRDVADEGKRVENAAELLKEKLGAKRHRVMKFYGSKNSIKYVLIHFTNHDRGFEKMNEVMWAIDPGGTFSVSQRWDPRTDWVFVPKASLEPLKRRFIEKFTTRTVRYNDLMNLAREVYLPKHCLAAVKELVAEGKAEVVGGSRVVAKQNQEIRFR